MAGGIGIAVRSAEELRRATEVGFRATVPVVVNVMVDPRADLPMVSIDSGCGWSVDQRSRVVGFLMARYGAAEEGGEALVWLD